MPQPLLGIVERFSAGKSRPGARLRPIFQASTDRSHWVKPDEEFPNSGVVSWWQPAPDADVYKAWIFQVEPSWTYDAEVEHHDYYGVKGSPAPPLELIDLPTARDPEDVRSFLLEEGIPLEDCVSRRVVFRDNSGSIIGPLELAIHDRRFFLEEKDAYIPLNRENGETLSLAEWQGHWFLPPEYPVHKIGEVDFSSNSVFLRRVLREIRDIQLPEIEKAKLTVKMIGEYTAAMEKNSLTPFQAHRLKRLHKMAKHVGAGITLGEDAIPDLLSLPPVQLLISAAEDRAIVSALDKQRAVLSELDARRVELEGKIRDLLAEEDRLRNEIAASRNQQAQLLESFESRIQEKFEEIGQSATSFLSDVTLIRAALFPTVAPSVRRSSIRTPLPKAEPLQSSDLISTFRQRFEDRGFGSTMPATLLSSLIAGYVPMLYGMSSRDALITAANTLFGGCAHFVTMGPNYSSPAEITGIPTTSLSNVGTVGEVIVEASQSEDLMLLVFDNMNMSQIDSFLMPILRSYAVAHGSLTEAPSGPYPTAAGMWPQNLLLAGVLIDSPLALPLSTDLWVCSTFIDASEGALPKASEQDNVDESSPLRVNLGEWEGWRKAIGKLPPASDTGVLATQFLRQIDASPLVRSMLRGFAAAIDMTAPTLEESRRAAMLAEAAVVPHLLSQGLHPDTLLGQVAVGIATDLLFVDKVTKLFEKWGIKVNRES